MGIPYQRHKPSAALRKFLDPLDPGSYFDCGRARLHGIDDVLLREAERRGRAPGDDTFQLVATDVGLVFCRPSISFAIAARWAEVTVARPVGDDSVVLNVTWPLHGELAFTVGKRLGGNVFRRWLQLQMQANRTDQGVSIFEREADELDKDELDKADSTEEPVDPKGGSLVAGAAADVAVCDGKPATVMHPDSDLDSQSNSDPQLDVEPAAAIGTDLSPDENELVSDEPVSAIESPLAKLVPQEESLIENDKVTEQVEAVPTLRTESSKTVVWHDGKPVNLVEKFKLSDPELEAKRLNLTSSAAPKSETPDDSSQGLFDSSSEVASARQPAVAKVGASKPKSRATKLKAKTEELFNKSASKLPRSESAPTAEDPAPEDSAETGEMPLIPDPPMAFKDGSNPQPSNEPAKQPESGSSNSGLESTELAQESSGGYKAEPIANDDFIGPPTPDSNVDVATVADQEESDSGDQIDLDEDASKATETSSSGKGLDDEAASKVGLLELLGADDETPVADSPPVEIKTSLGTASTAGVATAGKNQSGILADEPADSRRNVFDIEKIAGAETDKDSSTKVGDDDWLPPESVGDGLSPVVASTTNSKFVELPIAVAMATLIVGTFLTLVVFSRFGPANDTAEALAQEPVSVIDHQRFKNGFADPEDDTAADSSFRSAAQIPSGPNAGGFQGEQIDGADRDGADNDSADNESASGSSASATQLADEAPEQTDSVLCNSNYSGCVPDVSDVDCQNDGDGPAFLEEPVIVLGTDVYLLDTDDDGSACEPGQPESDGRSTP